ncbi:GCN5 family acetyltransferase [Methylobacterium tarhaniae]|uniref:GCN5 family acetyltransferase n=1 Tax=Methylobacterium tarhaniae TaxID=1187852 RepID=A0A0J6T070_9HYPH|nr:GNAT family N-acetyltransferase [Methylobacterium tarhaniae]KMO38973.1 GCN5 family acetyltransferase [Methylobacterium tarhaniae]
MAQDDGIPGDDVVLRPCREADLPAVTAIYARAVITGRASFELEPPDEAEMGRRRAALVDGGYPYLVAERAGAVVGYAYAGPYRTRPAYRGTVENSVYVRPDQAGRGLGRLLLERLIAEATAAGFRQMVAVIGDSHNAASIALHAALGFRHVGVLASVGWKHGAWLDTVLMQRPLGSGDRSPPDDGLGDGTPPAG